MVWDLLPVVHYPATFNNKRVYKATSIICEINEAAVVVFDVLQMKFVGGVPRKKKKIDLPGPAR